MSDLIFKISPNIILGSYTITRLSQYIKSFGTRFMVLTDPVLKEFKILDKVLQSLNEHKVEYFVCDEITDGANSREIEQILKLAKDGYIHGIIAVGGEKVQHAAAVVASLFNEIHDIYEFIDGAVPTSAPLSLVCVPTTMRAPYSFTSLIPIVDSRSRQAKLLKTQNNVCRLMVWEPNLYITLTENQLSSMEIETMCITVEAYLSQKANFLSDMFCEKAAELLGFGINGAKSLEITTPSEVLLAQGGCMTSLAAASSSVGLASLISLIANAKFRINRSLVCAIMFPHIIEDCAKFKSNRIETLGKKFGIIPTDVYREDACKAFAESVRQELAKANLPTRLKDLNLSIEQLATIAEDSSQLEIANTLPRSMSADDIFNMLKQAY